MEPTKRDIPEKGKEKKKASPSLKLIFKDSPE